MFPSGYIIGPDIPATGALTRTIRVVDEDGDPIVGAEVGMTGGFNDQTDEDGEVVFQHTSGTFTMIAAKTNYLGASEGPVALTESDTTILTMESLGILPSADPEQSTGFTTTRDGRGSKQGSVTLTFALTDSGTNRDSWSRRNFTSTSDASTALLQDSFYRGGEYTVRRGSGPAITFTVPDDPSFELPETLSETGS